MAKLDNDLKRNQVMCPLESVKQSRCIVTSFESDYGVKLRLVIFSVEA